MVTRYSDKNESRFGAACTGIDWNICRKNIELENLMMMKMRCRYFCWDEMRWVVSVFTEAVTHHLPSLVACGD